MSMPLVRDVLLLGGGHSHVIVIRKWAMKPIAGVRLTLVSQDALTPYTGMLPGLVAGHYSYDQSHIDLNRLCRWADVRFIRDTVTGVDPNQNSVQLACRPDFGFDLLSIDTGGAPRLENVEGAAEYTVPVKPVYKFWSRWQEIEQHARNAAQPMDIGVVGGGAGGFEILLAIQHRLEQLPDCQRHRFHWVFRSELLPGYTHRVRQTAMRLCRQHNITIHQGFEVVKVSKGMLHAADDSLALDEILWCTEATAASWPAASGLDCDERGFICLNDSLQSLSHPDVFAAGDVAIQVNHPRPRAGVFAVRQGPALFHNLQRAVVGRPLVAYKPQDHFLTLLSTGDKHAIAQRGPLSLSGNWVWRWKDWIDRRFVNRFNQLPPKQPMQAQPLPEALAAEMENGGEDMRCGGCGAKVPGDVLQRALAKVNPVHRDDLEHGLGRYDDVAVINPGSQRLAQSVDQLRKLVDDPWLFSRIATQHALSDLYASAAEPQSAMLTLGLPFAKDTVTERDLGQILDGVVTELNGARCTLSGGHTSEAAELTIGLVVNGYARARYPQNHSVPPGTYKLILAKGLGTGVIMAADMRGMAEWDIVEPCLQSMLQSNALAADALDACGVAGCTDVTGFGLIGHLRNMLGDYGAKVMLAIRDIPVLPGALSLCERGIQSSLFTANARNVRYLDPGEGVDVLSGDSRCCYAMLFDPQTCGGLLGLVPEQKADQCLDRLHGSGYSRAAIIGSAQIGMQSAEQILSVGVQ